MEPASCLLFPRLVHWLWRSQQTSFSVSLTVRIPELSEPYKVLSTTIYKPIREFGEDDIQDNIERFLPFD